MTRTKELNHPHVKQGYHRIPDTFKYLIVSAKPTNSAHMGPRGVERETEDRRHHRRPPKIRRIRGTPPSKTIPRGLPLHPCTTRAPCAMHVRVPCHTRTNPPPLSPYRTQEDNARRHPMGRRCTVSQSHSTIHPMQRHLDRRIEKNYCKASRHITTLSSSMYGT